MKRVLIPTNDRGYVYSLAKSYYKLGYEPTVGSMNFHLCLGSYDIVHFLWPEEFSLWCPPDERKINDVKKKLEWWRERSRLIISVQNFYPHPLKTEDAERRCNYYGKDLYFICFVGVVEDPRFRV